jgi:ADP-heptose:LPS heptosyltransferase
MKPLKMREGWTIPPRTATRTEGWSALRRILAVRLDAMGDVLMTTPALQAIRESARDAHLTLLTSSSGAEAARHVPVLDEVIVHDPAWMPGGDRRPAAAESRLVERLRIGGYEGAIVFTVHTQSPLPPALLLRLAGIKRVLAHCRENPYGLLSDWIPEPEPHEATRHEVRRQLDLVAHAGFRTEDERLSFRVPPDAMRRVRSRVLPSLGIELGDGTPWAVVHPGAAAASRRYPPAAFAEAAGRLARSHGVRIVFTGGRAEVPLVEEIRASMQAPSESVAGQLSLGELAALLAVAPLLIANNTGPVHIAAALGTPVVDLYALTNPQHTPWMVPSRVLNVDVPCAGCRRSVCPLGTNACLALVPADDVVSAALELLAEAPAYGQPRTGASSAA